MEYNLKHFWDIFRVLTIPNTYAIKFKVFEIVH